jgi:hypothetical protein
LEKGSLMPTTNFTSVISAQSVGTADVQALAASFDKLSGSIDGATQKANKVNDHPGFNAFAEKVKQGIENPLQALGSAAENALKALGPVGTGVAAAGAVFAAAGVAVAGFAKDLASYAIQIEQVSLKTGLARNEVQSFSFAAKAQGQDISVFDTAMRRLSQGIADTGDQGAKARKGLEQLGVQFRDVTGEIRPTSDIFLQIADGLAKMPDAFERNAVAVKVFGRGGIELIPTLLALRQNTEFFEQHGLGINNDELARWKEYQQSLTIIGAMWSKLKLEMESGIVAPIAFAVQKATEFDPTRDKTSLEGVGGGWVENFRRLLLGTNQVRTDVLGDALKGDAKDDQAFMHKYVQYKVIDPMVAFNNSRIKDFTAPIDDEAKLQEAKKKLGELRQEFQKGISWNAQFTTEGGDITSNEKISQQVAAQEAVVKSIEAQIKANRELIAQKERIAELDRKATDALQKAGGLGGPDIGTIGKFSSELGVLQTNRADEIRKNPAFAASVYDSFDKLAKAALETFVAEWQKSVQEIDKSAPDIMHFTDENGQRVIGDQTIKKSVEEMYRNAAGSSLLRGPAGVPELGISPEQQLRDSRNRTTRGLGLYSAQANLADVPEAQQATVLYELKKKYADDEYAALKRIAEAKDTEDEKEMARQDAKDQLADRRFAAELERDQALVQIQIQQKQEAESFAGSLFDALHSRTTNQFFHSYAIGQAKQLFENAASPIVGGAMHILGGAIPGQTDSSGNPTLIGNLLHGTVLDSAKADPARQTADNTRTTVGLLTDIRTLLSGGRAPSSITPGSVSSAAPPTFGGGGGGGGSMGPFVGPPDVFNTGGGLYDLPNNFNAFSPSMFGGGSPSGLSSYAMGGAGTSLYDLPSSFNAFSPTMSFAAPSVATGIAATLSKFAGGIGGPSAAISAWMGNPKGTVGYGPDGTPHDEYGNPIVTSTATQIGQGVSVAAAAATGVMTAVKEFSKGGASGALGGIGAIAGAASAIPGLGLIAAPIAAFASILSSVIGTGPEQRAKGIFNELSSGQYLAPTALHVTQGPGGTYEDFDARGGLRTSNFSAVPTVAEPYITSRVVNGQRTYYDVPGYQTAPYTAGPQGTGQTPVSNAPPKQTVIIQAMDSQSFVDFANRNHAAIGDAVATHLQNHDGRLSTQLRAGV